MLPHDRVQPAAQGKPSWPARIMRWVGRAPLLIKVVLVAAALVLWPFALPFALVGSAIAVAQKRPGRAAAYATATWVLPVAIFAHVYRAWTIPLLILPFVVAWIATTKKLASSYVPCRSTAWAMLWSIPTGFILLRVWPHQPTIGVVAAILIALAILGWRLAKVVQDERMYGRDGAQARRPGLAPAGPMPAGAPTASPPGRFAGHPGAPGYSVPARGAALPYAEHAVRDHPASAPRPRPQISIDDAMAELDAMIGLTSVKEQVFSIAKSIEAARQRAVAGITTDKPMRHFVFLGPGAGQDLLRLRPARYARGHRGAPGRPGRRVPRRDRDQDQRAGRLRPRRGAVHRRGLQPGQRGRRADRPVRRGGGPDAAQAGRGQPRGPDHHPGRVREADE